MRAFPGTIRGTQDWEDTYKIRSCAERTINHFKENLGVANRRTKNVKSIRADLLIAGIVQLFSAALADKIHKHQFIRSLKPLIAV